MRAKLNAVFHCLRHDDDGMCGAKIVVEGEHENERWQIAKGTCDELQTLYVDFVLQHLACPMVNDGCAECLSLRFRERLKSFGLYGDAPDDD